jgi:hypothetical protein
MMSFSSTKTSRDDFPLSILYTTILFLFMLSLTGLSNHIFDIVLLVAKIAVQFIVIIVHYILRIVALVV